MAGLGDSRYRLCILQPKASAGCDLDAIGSLGDQSGEHISASEDVRCAARGKDAIATCGDDIFQGLSEIRSCVEGAVEGCLQRSGQVSPGSAQTQV